MYFLKRCIVIGVFAQVVLGLSAAEANNEIMLSAEDGSVYLVGREFINESEPLRVLVSHMEQDGRISLPTVRGENLSLIIALVKHVLQDREAYLLAAGDSAYVPLTQENEDLIEELGCDDRALYRFSLLESEFWERFNGFDLMRIVSLCEAVNYLDVRILHKPFLEALLNSCLSLEYDAVEIMEVLDRAAIQEQDKVYIRVGVIENLPKLAVKELSLWSYWKPTVVVLAVFVGKVVVDGLLHKSSSDSEDE